MVNLVKNYRLIRDVPPDVDEEEPSGVVLFGEGLGHALKDALGILPMVVEVDATSVLVDLASREKTFLI